MASPRHGPAQPTSAPTNPVNNTNNNNHGHDHDLLQSLNKLSITTSPQSELDAPSDSASRRRQSSVPPNARASPRSPLTRANVNGVAADAQFTSSSLLRKASMNSLHSANGGTPSRPATSRRGSSTPFLSPTTAKSPNSMLPTYGEPVEERPLRTASSIAGAYFAKELELLHGTASNQSAETIVILQDDCYGHRYSRPRASKNLLSTIVERPERIQASVLGVCMAYVRLGNRHCEGKHPIHPDLDPTTLPGIPFRIHKTTRRVAISSTAVTNVHGNKWMEELKIMCDSAEAKLALNGNELRRPEMNRGSDAEPPQHFHQGDLYLCPESLNAFEGALGAVCEAVDLVFSASPHRRAFVAVRPPGHHCDASFPSGFCWVNNVHVGIMHGILNHGLTHAAIIDFDLHHGDGSQAIAWQHNKRGLTKNAAAWKKTSIGYFSIHDINSYPCEYGDEEKVKNASLCIENAHGQNIWNVHLHEWKSDVEFWKLYQSKYSILLEKARNYLRLQAERLRAAGQVPKAAIFLSAGFDAINVPTEFYARLTRDVVRIASEEGLGVDGRVISALEVLSHLSEGLHDFGHGTGHVAGSFSRRNTLNESDLKALKALEFPYDPSWWSVTELDLFDAANIPPPPEPKKPRFAAPANYSSPTQSSNAKMTEVAKMRRNLSNPPTLQAYIPRSPTPPPPDVSWITAAHELSRLLIPNDRQVNSCTHSELNAEAIKAKKERQSLQPAQGVSEMPAAPTRMSLRERKPVSYAEEDDYHSRRKTVAGPAVLATSKASTHGIPSQTETKLSRQANRRLSSASSLSMFTDGQVAADTSTRSGSSLSMRPTSSMSVLTQASVSSNARKSRPAAPPRKDSSRAPRAPRKIKPPPVKVKSESPPATTSPSIDNSDGNGPPLPVAEPVEAKADTSSTTAPSPKDLDQITNGMKKIKINVLTKEQKEARLRAKAEAAASGGELTPEEQSPLTSQPSYQSMVPEPQPNQSSTDVGNPQQDPISPFGDEDPFQHGRSTPMELKAETAVPMTPTITSPTEPSLSSTPFVSSPAVQLPPDAVPDMDLFVPYQPDGPPPRTIPIQGPVEILEPNTGTPARPNPTQQARFQSYSVPVTPARRGGHGFTAKSSIPFSPGPARNTAPISQDNAAASPPAAISTQGADSGVWEIPETPRHQQ
ncbi:hypothetical protein F4802DRAFT_616745 [Xylaria palmicola]|nr:hypothetical protein F4802DRAFT_616745 [Xylaria palmicola]